MKPSPCNPLDNAKQDSATSRNFGQETLHTGTGKEPPLSLQESCHGTRRSSYRPKQVLCERMALEGVLLCLGRFPNLGFSTKLLSCKTAAVFPCASLRGHRALSQLCKVFKDVHSRTLHLLRLGSCLRLHRAHSINTESLCALVAYPRQMSQNPFP